MGYILFALKSIIKSNPSFWMRVTFEVSYDLFMILEEKIIYIISKLVYNPMLFIIHEMLKSILCMSCKSVA